ncbi:MAG TPA: YceI family protein [Gemmatimonadales bacterium]|nr:YceI family protein [Gemmatimonadales bacterium]
MTRRTIFALLLLALFRPSPAVAQQDSVVYRLAPGSRFEVTAHKSGVFSFVGHEHLIRARSFSGRIVYVPSAPERSRLEVVLPTDSLEVLTPPDTAEIRKVTAAMRADVLDVPHHPEIRFESTALARTADGFRVTGMLTMVGKAQQVMVDIKTAVGPDTLRAAGEFEVKQTAFGIQPYHGGPGGLVRVADRVTFHFEAIGLRAESH